MKLVFKGCTQPIRDMTEHLTAKYGDRLGPKGLGSTVQEIFQKLDWAMKEMENIQALRGRLQESMQRLSLLSTLAAE
jgi:hypothetical protein